MGLNCGLDFLECPGHFGHFNIDQTIFHNGYFKRLLQVLKIFCFECGKIMSKIPENLIIRTAQFTKQQTHFRKILEAVDKAKLCHFCKSPKHKVKKLAHGMNRILYQQKTFMQKKNINVYGDLKNQLFLKIGEYSKKIQEDKITQYELDPYQVKQHLSKINKYHWKYLLSNSSPPDPKNLLVSIIPVPPLCIRPTVEMGNDKTNENDVTLKIFEFIKQKQIVKTLINQGKDLVKIEEQRYLLQLIYNQLINSDSSESNSIKNTFNASRGLLQRIKGKQGRFRGNLSGKRVEYSGRTVISPDPNLKLNEVAIPLFMAKELTYPEKVTDRNIERLKQCIRNGRLKHPGANHVQIGDKKNKYFLKNDYIKEKILENLKIGDTVFRHIDINDVILFNRQPSLHRQSIMGFRMKLHNDKTLKFNECVCSPFNADFDGDEMNIHVVQTEEAKAEAMILMNSQQNILNVKDGNANITLIQDFLSQTFKLTSKDTFLTKQQFCKVLSFASNADQNFQIPIPSILYPYPLWTGKQVINTLLNPSIDKEFIYVNLAMKEKSYDSKTAKKEFDDNDGYVRFHNGILISGKIGKGVLGGSKNGLIYFIAKRSSHQRAREFMESLAKLSSRLIETYGLSFGIKDVTPDSKIAKYNYELFKEKNEKTKQLIEEALQKKKKGNDGIAVDYEDLDFESKAELEAEINYQLNQARDQAGSFLLDTLRPQNNAFTMAVSGAKGSALNICQMVSTVGQQSVMGKRIRNGFLSRTLPHFPRHDQSPSSRGFVQNSFYTGLLPTEFFFHTMAGREGLIDTAVKTADTGYMQRKLIKVMEDLVVEYDFTVRNSDSKLVQFIYGEDAFDPQMCEDSEFVLNLKTIHYLVKDYDNSITHNKTKKGEQMTEKFFKECQNFQRCFNKNEKLQKTIQNFLYYVSSLKIKVKDKESIKNNLLKYLRKCVIQPGEAVGAITAQALGEPCTQMTLKTFHFAGVASMNVTLGVPRIKEIFNAVEDIKTPIMEVFLQNSFSSNEAIIVKNKIEAVQMKDILISIKEVYQSQQILLVLQFDLQKIKNSFLDVDLSDIKEKLIKAKLKLKEKNVAIENDQIIINSPLQNIRDSLFYFKYLCNVLQNIIICGLSSVKRALINKKKDKQHVILAEGIGFDKVLRLQGVDSIKTKTNHIHEINKALGIEAAVFSIKDQIQQTFNMYGIKLDQRHLSVLADCMTFTGKIYGLNRYGIVKMKNSPIMLASFEKTGEILFDAAFFGAIDYFKGASEKIILGETVNVGTGKFKIFV